MKILLFKKIFNVFNFRRVTPVIKKIFNVEFFPNYGIINFSCRIS